MRARKARWASPRSSARAAPLDAGVRETSPTGAWCAAPAPPPVLENFQLPKADDGFLAVKPTLRTTADHPVFVVGDTATIVDQPVPKAGVYAVREGPVLWDNVQRLFDRYHKLERAQEAIVELTDCAQRVRRGHRGAA